MTSMYDFKFGLLATFKKIPRTVLCFRRHCHLINKVSSQNKIYYSEQLYIDFQQPYLPSEQAEPKGKKIIPSECSDPLNLK